MSFLNIQNVQIKGISACVPKVNDCILDIYKWGGGEAFVKHTGIRQRRRTSPDLTASDLCETAAKTLIESLGWNKSDIDALIFVSQTPDYPLPSTSCLLQSRLGLSKECLVLDISLGCSGWVYALSVLGSLMQNGTIKKGLLLAGDTITKLCSSEDKTTYPLFGDAGTATALEFSPHNNEMKFVFNSDGGGYEAIIAKEGGYRHLNETRPNLKLDGSEVFSFGVFKVPKQIKNLINQFNIKLEEVNIFTFHQANLMMNEMIRKKLNLPQEKVPYSLAEFGNTSCASIPLTLVTKEGENLKTKKLQHIASGFGVGLSWASVWFETDKIVVPSLVEI